METTDREDCTPMVWYRSLYAPRTGGAYDSHHRTAGIAGCTWRRGDRVAARARRPASGAVHQVRVHHQHANGQSTRPRSAGAATRHRGRGDRVKRREVITLIGGAAAAWPLAAGAQQGERMRRIGILMGYAESDPVAQARVAELRRGLQELGWTEGRNVRFDYRWPGVDPPRIRVHAVEIVELAPDVIISSPAQVTLELNRVTNTLPILFVNVPDPVELGLVASIAHPGGNMTGFANFEHALAGKWLDILKELTPSATRIGVFYSRQNPACRGPLQTIEQTAPSLGVQLAVIGVSEASEIEDAFNSFAQEKIGALIVLPSIFVTTHRSSIVALAARYRFPAIYPFRFFVADGGLLAYGVDVNDQFWRVAVYADRILKGAKPADLPVQGPTKFELVINVKTAKALGVTVPDTLLALADEVIE